VAPLKISFLALLARVAIVSTIQKAVKGSLNLPVDNFHLKTSRILGGLNKAKNKQNTATSKQAVF
jgi:hypothetical protein